MRQLVHRVHGQVLVTLLSLYESDGAQIAAAVLALALRGFFKGVAPVDSGLEGLLPAGARLKADRQLDHRVALELGCADAVQDVAWRIACRRSGELDNAGRVEPCKSLEGKWRARVVRLIHDDNRLAEVECVGKRWDRLVGILVAFESFGGFRRYVFEMACDIAVLLVYLALVRLANARSGESRDYDHGLAVVYAALQVLRFPYVHNANTSIKRRVKRLPVGVCAIPERGKRLILDRVGWHEPENRAPFLAQEALGRHRDRVAGHEGLAAAGGHAQTDIGRVRKLFDAMVRPLSSRVEGDVHVVCLDRQPEVFAKLLETPFLVTLKWQRAQFTFTS